jgi:hypothetical protein
MKIFATAQTRQEYAATQIARSDAKFAYCKVSIDDVAKYHDLLRRDRVGRGETPELGPILCLGTRNGREVDLFRTAFFGRWPVRAAVRAAEHHTHSFVSRWAPLERLGRSDARAIGRRSAVGVEINPRGARRDVWTGSFDDLPAEWARRFDVVYSNSFDQSHDPDRTAEAWAHVVAPTGYLIFCFTRGVEPTPSDRVGGLTVADVLGLFGGELVYFHERGSRTGYSEVILRAPYVRRRKEGSALR